MQSYSFLTYRVCDCMFGDMFFFFKQKTAYEMRISDWSSDVCSSDLVGYLVLASARTLSLLGAVGDAVSVQTEMQVREESITLFGFATVGERDWFRLLTSVQGVGGRVALAILSTLSPEELQTAIARADKAMIARANGVGPKLALRIARTEEPTYELQ